MATDPKSTGRPHDDKRDDKHDGVTSSQQGGTSSPRLPHERDESSDTSSDAAGTAPRMGRQGHDDLASGQVDTDKGPVLDKIYNEKLGR